MVANQFGIGAILLSRTGRETIGRMRVLREKLGASLTALTRDGCVDFLYGPRQNCNMAVECEQEPKPDSARRAALQIQNAMPHELDRYGRKRWPTHSKSR
ncbi:hypothetical protein U0C82_11160 [Fulvimarina sp. 2208YS6-2-32]|uniref:Uncharacterized protein n=1 Tax=Fulvimarina uroteuthidis TaxID=3098149 RepID=A0ABU5I2W3_9HYPH|nr:hypothetical protein [Fulvimarina sp. 2208YS6-2-32]MDY8109696.1 hypothetical protein [Fulvimarina sp. 2208YS6-2-32]